MIIIAQSIKGEEFIYDVRTAHKVPKQNAQKIADALNRIKYKLKDKHIWFVHEIDEYDVAFNYASFQSFSYGKRGIVRRAS